MTQPASTATKPKGPITSAARCSQGQSYSRPLSRAIPLNRPSASMARPIPTISRNDQNTIGTGGHRSRGTLSSPGIGAFRSCLRISEPSLGMPTAWSSVPVSMLGSPNRYSGAPLSWLSKCPSIAMTLVGWCSSVFSPCWSPAKIWIGATRSSIHIAIENMTRLSSCARRRSMCQAAHAPTTSAVVR